jgi:lysophospholipase L1-like esterase
MSMRSSSFLSLLVLAALSCAAHAYVPPDPGPGPDGVKNHVHRLKPWRAKLQYQMERDAVAHTELNARADLQAQTLKGQWWPIDCQLYNVTQNGRVLWNHIPNVGWVSDDAIRTYTNGRLQGSPTCAKPGPGHVWFKQRWALRKQYRAIHRAQAYDRPGGAPVAAVLQTGEWTSVNCHQLHNGHQWAFIDFAGQGSGYVRAGALRFWQAGLPAGLPACVKPPPPVRTWVAMGDSYAAGQGANDYFGGDCRRSSNSYWALLHTHLKHGLQSDTGDFVACSGATTGDLRAHQLGALDPTTRLVTISIGGNDLGFAGVLTSCVEPYGTSCKDAIASHFRKRDLAGLRRKLRATYSAIRSHAASATVLVLGYPELVPRDHVDGCGAMDSGDAPYLHRAAVRLNRNIRRAIGDRRGFRFVGLVKTFLGHPACNNDAADWINGVVATDKQESFHPNEAGHRAIAARLRSGAPGFFS